MVEIVWTEPALEDSNEIAEYIALDNPGAAEKLVSRVIDRIELLEESPNSGRKVHELKRTRYREVIVGPCRVFYRATQTELIVLYVMQAERLLKNYILAERETYDS